MSTSFLLMMFVDLLNVMSMDMTTFFPPGTIKNEYDLNLNLKMHSKCFHPFISFEDMLSNIMKTHGNSAFRLILLITTCEKYVKYNCY